LDKSAY